MKPLAVLLLAAGVLAAGSLQTGGPSRAAIVDAQNHFDTGFTVAGGRDPMELLSTTQGVYLRGVGAIFTAQVDLIVTPGLIPFRTTKVQPAELAAIRKRKLDHIPVLKQTIQEIMVSTAKVLDALPLKEQLVVAVSLVYRRWEDREGLPSQIVMRAVREPLLKGDVNAIQVDEY